MADMVSSAVIQETVSQIISGAVRKYEENKKPNAKRNVERLEMAHIRLQAALDISNKWQITDASLLRWRRKLKHAAQECDDTLQKCKQRILEDEQMEQEMRNFPFHKLMAHAAKSFIFSSSRNNNSSNTSVVQRFEWFADGASEFLKFIERRATPRLLLPFDPLIRHLIEGKKLQQKFVTGNECPLLLLWLPFSSTEYGGVQATLNFFQKDSYAPDGSFIFGVKLQVSESTDIIGTTIKCLQLFPPHLKSVAETIQRKVTQLPTLDFSWVPFADSCQREHWSTLSSLTTKWFCPEPFCCKQHGQHSFHRTINLDMAGSPQVSLEPIIDVNLWCQISYSKYNKKRTLFSEPKGSLLQVGLVYMPHGSSEDMLPADESSAVAEIRGREKHWLHTNITLEELNDTMLPKANDYFMRNTEAVIQKMFWRSRHGTAYIQFKKASIEEPSARMKFKRSRRTELVQLRDQDVGFLFLIIVEFFNSFGEFAPSRLRNLVTNWVQKEKDIQLQHQHST